MESWHTLLTLVVLLAGALVLGAVFERLKQSAIVGYLLAGAAVGPGGMNIIGNEASVVLLAELGVALLLFTIGLEFSLSRLRALGSFALFGGTLQIILTAALFGAAGMAAGLPAKTAALLGILAAPSSTACVLRILRDRAELDSVHGRGATGILLLQDLALVPLVLIVATLSGEGTDRLEMLRKIALAALLFGLLVAVFYALSTWLLPRVFHAAAMLRNRELLILLAATLTLGSAWVAHAFHLSPAIGAFLAGLMLAGSPFAAQLRADVSALRVLFVTLFFTSVGMLADLGWIVRNAPLVAVATAVILVGKAAIVIPLGRLFRYSPGNSVAAALSLAQIGEFSFVLGEIARKGGAIGERLFQLLVSAALITMLLTPMLVALAPRARDLVAGRARLRRVRGPSRPARPLSHPAGANDADQDSIHALSNHVVVVGYGPAGRQVVAPLLVRNLPVVLIDLNPQGVRRARLDGVTHALLGDATHEEILEHVSLKSARALVVTIPDHRAALSVVRHATAMAGDVPVFTRARYAKYAPELAAAGAHATIDEEVCIGRELARQIESELV